MISEINKGRLFALMQFLLIGTILVISYLFRKEAYSYFLSKITGIILISAGIGISLISFLSFRQTITPNPAPLNSSKLVTTGIYKFIRHPMYLSVIVLTTGWCFSFFSIVSLIMTIPLVIFFITKIKFEESLLVKKFPLYFDYKSKTFRLIPYIY